MFSLFVSLAVFIVWMNKPSVIKNIKKDDLINYIENLTNHEIGSILVIQHQKSKKFIQIVLPEHSDKITVFQFGFPYVPWIKPYYSRLKDYLKKSEIGFEINKTGLNDIPEFADITIEFNDIVEGLAKALTVVELAILAFDIPAEDMFNVHYKGILTMKSSLPMLEEYSKQEKKTVLNNAISKAFKKLVEIEEKVDKKKT